MTFDSLKALFAPKPAIIGFERTSPFVSVPQRSRPGDAAIDIKAAYNVFLSSEPKVIRTELNIAIPKGYVGLICSRSGLSAKGIYVVNAPGVIDANYRGELCVILASLVDQKYMVRAGDRIAQLLLMKLSDFYVAEYALDENKERGTAGLGSSGL